MAIRCYKIRDFLADRDRYGTKEVLCADPKERDLKPTSKATTTGSSESGRRTATGEAKAL